MKNIINEKKVKIIWVLIILLSSVASVSAQNSRSYIKEQIQRWGYCRTVAITKTNGDLALYGQNGWAASGIPTDLQNEIRRRNSNSDYIREITLTENGRWLLLYGDNGVTWGGIPDNDSLLRKLREYNSQRETITSVTFNDYGEWIVITTNYISSSDNNIQNWLVEGLEWFGQLWTTCISDNDGIVAVYENGYRFIGNVPQGLKDALNRTRLNPVSVKFAGSSWFFADNDGYYEYNM